MLNGKIVGVVLLVAVLVGVSVCWAAVLYTLERGMGVYVVRDGEIQLYLGRLCEIVAGNMTFGRMLPGESRNSTLMFLKNLGKTSVQVKWTCLNLPAGFSVRGFFGPAGSLDVDREWVSGPVLGEGGVCPVMWELTVSSTVQSGRYYNWTLQLQSSS